MVSLVSEVTERLIPKPIGLMKSAQAAAGIVLLIVSARFSAAIAAAPIAMRALVSARSIMVNEQFIIVLTQYCDTLSNLLSCGGPLKIILNTFSIINH